MPRERALKVVLVVVGLLFSAAVIPLVMMVKQDPALAMTMSLYATLGIFLLLASRNPLSAPQPDRLHGMVELRTCHCDECAGIPKFHRSQRTDWVGCVHPDWRSLDRIGFGKGASRATFYFGGVRPAPLVWVKTNAARAAVFSSCVHGEPTVFPRLEMCCRTRAAAPPKVALARSSSSRSRRPTTGMRQCSHASRTTLRKNSPSAACTRAWDARIFEREGKARPEASSIAQPTTG